MTTDIAGLSRHLLPYYRTSPVMRALVQADLNLAHRQIDDRETALRKGLNLDDSTGIWLDWLGHRLGVERPLTEIGTNPEWFGFEGAGVGFDQAPFRSEIQPDPVGPLPDELYRNMLKARTITIFAIGNIQDFTAAVNEIDAAAVVTDNFDMSVTVATDLQYMVQLADDYNCLPHTAGVKVLYAEGP